MTEFITGVGTAVFVASSLGVSAWLVSLALDAIVKATGTYRIVATYIWHRKEFHEWLGEKKIVRDPWGDDLGGGER